MHLIKTVFEVEAATSQAITTFFQKLLFSPILSFFYIPFDRKRLPDTASFTSCYPNLNLNGYSGTRRW